MAGTRPGGIRAAEKNKIKYGPDFYRRIGAMGGKIGRSGGFYGNPERAKVAGALGGSRSKVKPYGPLAIGFYPFYEKYVEPRCGVPAEVFIEMYEKGFSHDQIGDVIGRKRGSVSNMIKAAKKDNVL